MNPESLCMMSTYSLLQPDHQGHIDVRQAS
jgi:hypothetical protein